MPRAASPYAEFGSLTRFLRANGLSHGLPLAQGNGFLPICIWGAGRESSPLTRGGGATSFDNRCSFEEGVPNTRLFIINHGSDRPTCLETTESCAARNRRVHFRVKKE
jgi:hypothetical protein